MKVADPKLILKRQERHVHWRIDLCHAIRCVDQILNRHLHDSEDPSDADLLKCLTTALIVSYCRPFTDSNAPSGVPRILPKSYRSEWTDSEAKLHKSLLERRHRDQAHSDANGRETTFRQIKGPKGSSVRVPFCRDPDGPLDREAVEGVRVLAGKILAKVIEQEHALAKKLEVMEKPA
jgi:hypothetical protein